MEKKLCLLLLVVNIHLTSSASHSLQYLHTAVTSGVKVTNVSTVGLVDGERTHYNDIKKKIPNTIKEEETREDHRNDFKREATSLMKCFNPNPEEVHTVTWMYRCEVHDDNTTRGYSQYSYDRKDLFILDLNSLTWTAANAKAVSIKQKWKCDDWAGQVKDYLVNECIDWLQKFVEYGRSTLERKETGGDSVGGSDRRLVIVGASLAIVAVLFTLICFYCCRHHLCIRICFPHCDYQCLLLEENKVQ